MIRHVRALLAVALLVGAATAPAPVRAAWTVEGLHLSDTTGFIYMSTQIPDGAGGIIVVWLDINSPTNTIVRAQRVDNTGKPRWGNDNSGIAVSSAPGGKLYPRAIPDDNGGAIIVWGDKRNTGNSRMDHFAQRVSASGNPQWTPDGVAIHTTGTGLLFAIASDGSGGAIVVWADDRNGNFDVFARRITSAGVPMWTATGVPICLAAGDQQAMSVVPDGSGGAFIAWWDRRSPVTGQSYLLAAQRVNAAGTVQWTANGRVLPDSTAWPLSRDLGPSMVASAPGSAILAWGALNRTEGLRHTIGQRLNLAGNSQWFSGGRIICRETSREPSLAADGRGGAYLGLDPPDDDFGTVGAAQRIDSLGNNLWGFRGRRVCRFQSLPEVVASSDGGAILAWDDVRHGISGGSRLYAQRVDSTGTAQWTEDGVGVRVGLGGQSASPGIVADRSGGAILVWELSNPNATWIANYVRRVTSAGMGRLGIQGTAGGRIELQSERPMVVDTVWIASGETARFRFRSNPGYYVDDVTVDGASVGVAPNLSLGFSAAPRALHVDFANGTWFEPSLPTPANGYINVSFPVTFTVDTVRAVLGNLGPFDDTQWRMARWDPVAGGYQFAGDQLTRIRSGEGYWLITRTGLAVQAQGKPLTTDTAGVDLPGGVGWHQIANPYRSPVADTAINVLSQGTLRLFTDPSSNTIIDRTIWEWTGGSNYDSVRTMQPRRAYWIHKSSATPARLVFPNRSSTRPNVATLAVPDDAEWMLTARAVQRNRASARVALGGWRRGRAEPLRMESPPDPPQGGLKLRLVDANGARRVAEFREAGGAWEWVLELSGADAPGEVTLEWSAEALPAGLRLWLLEPARGFSHEIRPGASVTLAATREPRRLTLRADDGDEGAPVVPTTAIGAAYPNPFRDGVGLTLQLARPDVARVAIFDLQGRVVRDLGARSLAAGEHVLVWDGADAAGRPTAPGVYLARIEIGAVRESRRLLRLH